MGPLWLFFLAGCPRQWIELEREESCRQAGYSIASVTFQCTGKSALANKRAIRLENEYVCTPPEPILGPQQLGVKPQEVEDLFACAVALNALSCDDEAEFGNDLQAWIDSNEFCPSLFELAPDDPVGDDDDDDDDDDTDQPMTGLVKGTVLVDNDVRVAGIDVCVQETGACTTTNDLGEYRIEDEPYVDHFLTLVFSGTDVVTTRHQRRHNVETGTTGDRITLFSPAKITTASAGTYLATQPWMLVNTSNNRDLSNMGIAAVYITPLDSDLEPTTGEERFWLMNMSTDPYVSTIGSVNGSCDPWENQRDDTELGGLGFSLAEAASGSLTLVTVECP